MSYRAKLSKYLLTNNRKNCVSLIRHFRSLVFRSCYLDLKDKLTTLTT